MTLPNFISLGRLLAVPFFVWALIDGNWTVAFVIFALAALTDAVDGFLARALGQNSELGVFLDPLADKALLVAAFLGLGLMGRVPSWLVVAIVARDVLIVAGVVLSKVMDRPVAVDPLLVSKANTCAQIALAGVVLAGPGLGLSAPGLVELLVALTAILTAASAAAYLVDWMKHMAGQP